MHIIRFAQLILKNMALSAISPKIAIWNFTNFPPVAYIFIVSIGIRIHISKHANINIAFDSWDYSRGSILPSAQSSSNIKQRSCAIASNPAQTVVNILRIKRTVCITCVRINTKIGVSCTIQLVPPRRNNILVNVRIVWSSVAHPNPFF